MPLRKELEKEESHPRLQEKVAECWEARWHQVVVALKFKELQRPQTETEAWSPQVGDHLPLPPHVPPLLVLFPTAQSFLLRAI